MQAPFGRGGDGVIVSLRSLDFGQRKSVSLLARFPTNNWPWFPADSPPCPKANTSVNGLVLGRQDLFLRDIIFLVWGVPWRLSVKESTAFRQSFDACPSRVWRTSVKGLTAVRQGARVPSTVVFFSQQGWLTTDCSCHPIILQVTKQRSRRCWAGDRGITTPWFLRG